MLTALLPHHSRVFTRGQNRHFSGADAIAHAVGLKGGTAAQRHLYQHEIFERLRPDFYLAAVAQRIQFAAGDLAAIERRIDTAPRPIQLMLHQRLPHQTLGFLRRAAGENRLAAHQRQVQAHAVGGGGL
ncbi:hypothetical protein D3C72_747320 [compost metagenome]